MILRRAMSGLCQAWSWEGSCFHHTCDVYVQEDILWLLGSVLKHQIVLTFSVSVFSVLFAAKGHCFQVWECALVFQLVEI